MSSGNGRGRGNLSSNRASFSSVSRGRGDPGNQGGGQGRGWRGGGDFGDAERGQGRGTLGHGGQRGSFRGRNDGQGRGGFAARGQNFRGGPPPGIYAARTTAKVDPRLEDNSQDELVKAMKSWSLDEKKRELLPLRPGFGEKGRNIHLRSNYFPVVIPDAPIFEYDVSISSAKSNKIGARVKRRVFKLAEESAQWSQHGLKDNVAHDHIAKVLAAKELPNSTSIEVEYYDEEENGPPPNTEKYTVTLEKTRALQLQDLVSYTAGQRQYKEFDIAPLLSALNIILSSHATSTEGKGVMVGRNKFFFPNTSMVWELGGGLQAFRGFYSSVRPTHYQLMVNVNVCTTAFYKAGNMANAMLEFERASKGANPKDFVKKGLRIRVIHLNRYKTVNTLNNSSASQYVFETPEYPNGISVEDFYRKKHKITLRYPGLPLVDASIQGKKMKVLFPPELCEILPNQAFLGKLTDTHTSNMIEIAAQPPNANATAIVDQGLKLLGFAGTSSPRDKFGVTIKPEMTVVPGRILDRPRIEYGRYSSTPPIDERASWNLRGVKFTSGRKLDNWAVLVIHDGSPDEFQLQDPALKVTITAFTKTCQDSGMQGMTPPQYLEVTLPEFDKHDPLRENAIEIIRRKMDKLKLNLVLILLADGNKHIYAGIKRLFDTILDIGYKIKNNKGQVQYFANVALKINAKLGGVNHKLDKNNNNMTWFAQQPTMLVGIDVTHPGKGTVKGTPSIAAVVANWDAHFVQFPASMELQKSKQEMVQALDGMMIERLKLYKGKNKKLPERILIYRDGVSEGQYHLVMEEEFPKIRAAFESFNTPQKRYQPKLTIVICGKRHHTRFYPTASADADPKKSNPLPGTVVDRGVTSVYHFDFFLQAHGGLQGSTKPTHYFVVHDTIGFNADQIQGLTNAICYTFARATKAVSLAAPAYYADLACERGRCYIHRLLHGHSNSGVTSRSNDDEEVMKEAAQLWNNGVNGARLKDTMYYL
ncbi:hypothetical protein APHAL10511_007272 [Amanita phalloides]|nr:hypothetical protein APHAL10511_007272 [Amanita phalloides]